MDFFQVIRDRNVTTSEIETTGYFAKTPETRTQYNVYEYDQERITSEATNGILKQSSIYSERSTLADDNSYEDKESYDYERIKMEYKQQLEDDVREGKVLNYTEKEGTKNTLRRALNRVMDLKRPKNCTKEELSQIGIKALECLLYDYQRTKDITAAKMVLSRTWLVLRVWLLIYICLAIVCWCQRGWCCCCFRCKFCFPRKRTVFIKQYYAMNPPGIFVKDLRKGKQVKDEATVKYEATEYEYDAYKTLEAAIRNI
ncbi:PREDICTED: uncharacterized protein LOC105561294 [Vollenhovia emeryi]|uniref:uncharacterized protein LOC105561294 n=1 Tax=Vollenhovia emeryi TaxID=411798 RepID=UPI0005F4C0DD|nr:PREDICTED: uncharacterized protein LOC105561294 [Vollenhovia emeryi]